MFLQVGDDVVVKNHPNKVSGTVTRVMPSFTPATDDKYEVTFHDTTLIPRSMEYIKDQLTEYSPFLPKGSDDQLEFDTTKCECGRDSIGEGNHSYYCPLQFKNYKY